MIRQAHLIAVVGTLLMGCAILLVVGGSGVQATATEEQGPSDDRCEGTRFVTRVSARYTTNDVPGCPRGGLLSGTDVDDDFLAGVDGDDEIRGLGGIDSILGGEGNDVIYGGPGADDLDGGQDDDVIYGGDGNDALGEVDPGDDVLYGEDGNDFLTGGHGKAEDVLYGGDGNDLLDAAHLLEVSVDGKPDKLYCGEGRDEYRADKNDYVDSSCEKKAKPPKIIVD